ncbi:MAG: type II secretion system protein GspD [Rhodospirillaceae bacterium]|nr:type II secretion system protein GspD [Rhodospirillaceae bacterium]|tara:strand:- start:2388 stop:4421 length:2034 start_codon:yes stop_codon:yes gene_type:complete
MNIKIVIFLIAMASVISSCKTIETQFDKFTKTKILNQNNHPPLTVNPAPNLPTATNPSLERPQMGEPIDRIYPPISKSMKPTDPNRNVSSPVAGRLSLELDQVGLREALKIILGDLLRLNYVLTSNIKGQVTLKTVKPLTRKQMLAMLESLLELNGLKSVQQDGIVKILPSAGATKFSTGLFANSDRPGHGIEIASLKHVSSLQMVKLLSPIVAEGAVIPVDGAKDIIFINGSQKDREAVKMALTILDVDHMAQQHVAIFGLVHSKPDTIIGELRQVFQSNGDSVIRLTPIKRLNALLVIAPNNRYIRRAQTWIKRLDKTLDADERRLFVYFVKHGDAGNLVKTLKGAFSELSDSRQLSQQNTSDEIAKKTEINKTRINGRPSFNSDASSNSILVWATGREYDLISEVLAKLDIAPLQVLIEGTVLEVSLQNNLRYGLKYLIEAGEFQSLFTQDNAATVTPILPGFGAIIGGANNTKIVIDALSELTNVRVVSSPQLLVMDGGTARLHVGDQVPIIRRSSSANTSEDNRITNEIEYRNTGVTLDVTPSVKASGIVTLKISQEVSDVVRTNSSNIDSPTIQQRQVVSTASLPSGTTVLLAGLIREINSGAETGLPFLHQIPGIGSLFGATGDTTQRTELVVLITPKVMRGKAEVENATSNILKKYQSLINSNATGKLQ